MRVPGGDRERGPAAVIAAMAAKAGGRETGAGGGPRRGNATGISTEGPRRCRLFVRSLQNTSSGPTAFDESLPMSAMTLTESPGRAAGRDRVSPTTTSVTADVLRPTTSAGRGRSACSRSTSARTRRSGTKVVVIPDHYIFPRTRWRTGTSTSSGPSRKSRTRRTSTTSAPIAKGVCTSRLPGGPTQPGEVLFRTDSPLPRGVREFATGRNTDAAS